MCGGGALRVALAETPQQSQVSSDSVDAVEIEPPTFYEQLSTDLPREKQKFLTLTVENDLFGNGQDRNYTNGVRLTYFDFGADIPSIVRRTVNALPGFDVNETTSIYYTFGQNLYTPAVITAPVPDPNDRPYAAFLYGSAGLTNVTDNHVDDLELTLGVVGPMALGDEVQTAVHRVVGADDPSGWDYQLHNEPGVIVSWQRAWLGRDDMQFSGLNFRAIPHGGVTLGNVYTYANAGATLQLTPKQYRWQALPPRVRPAITGSGFFQVPEDHFAWSLFLGGEGRLVGRNLFLDGNSFRDSPSVDKRYLVADVSGGVALTYGRAQLSYTLNWRSREFRGQDDQSLFGAISLGYRF